MLWERRGAEWVALSTRHDEIADVVKDVLGMGLEQFSKVVLLPQGDFAAFLRATPEERRSLLERLFDVSSFAGVEDWFAAQRKETGAVVADQRAALNADLAVLADVLADAPDLEGGSGDWSDLPLIDLPGALEAARQALDEGSTVRLAAVDATRLADEAASTAHALAAETVARRTRGLSARTSLAALTAEAETRDAAAARVELAERATSVAGDLKALDRVVDARLAAERGVASTQPDVARWALDGRGTGSRPRTSSSASRSVRSHCLSPGASVHRSTIESVPWGSCAVTCRPRPAGSSRPLSGWLRPRPSWSRRPQP